MKYDGPSLVSPSLPNYEPKFVDIFLPLIISILAPVIALFYDQPIIILFGGVLACIAFAILFKRRIHTEMKKARPLMVSVNGKPTPFYRHEIASHDVDPQKTFTPLCPNELPVPDGDRIVQELNNQAALAKIRTCSKEAHNPGALHIATPSKPQFTPIEGEPDLDCHWNSHGQSGTTGAEFLDGLPDILDYHFVAYKGMESNLHPYGGCYHDTHGRLSTGLIEFYRYLGIKLVIVGGLATDYCVKATVLQLLEAGFVVIVNMHACRGVSMATTADAINEMAAAGAKIMSSCSGIESLRYEG